MPSEEIANSEDYELLLPPGQREATDMGQEEQIVKKEDRKGDVVAFYAAMCASIVCLIITCISVLANHPTQVGWFVWHPILQSLALVLLTYGILTLQPTSQPKTKEAGLKRHQIVILGGAFPLVFLGTFAVTYTKFLRDKHHLKSLHGKLGLATMCWMVFQIILGGGSVWGKGVAFGGGMKAKLVWRYHRISGYVLVVLLLATVNLGGASGWARKYVADVPKFIAYTAVPVIILGALLVRVRWSKMKIF